MSQQDVVLVTGSSGFIGSALINKLAGRYRLVGVDRIATHSPPPAAECVCIDLTSERAAPSMPRLTALEIGIVPVLQMLIQPPLIFGLVARFQRGQG